MADAIISVVVERVADILVNRIQYEVNLVRGMDEELIDLSDKLKTIKNVLADAEIRGVNDQSIKSWLKKLENTAYEMDDILDEWNYSLLKHNMETSANQKVGCSFIPSSSLCFKKVFVHRETSKKIEHVKATLDKILKERNDFNFVISRAATDHVPNSCHVQTTSLVESEKVFGLDVERNKNDVVKKMLNDGNTQILSIVGTGGLGKTTLAQLIYNDTQVGGCFTRIWICVSDPFDVVVIAKGIVESVTKEIIPPNMIQLEMVLEKLRDCISGKKFLPVLDDVWEHNYNKWEPLKINLKYGAPGSKILVTTRNERVAKMMGALDGDIYRPKPLSDEECWSLLRLISLQGQTDAKYRKFEDVGKKIANKCKGLPLAANVLGRLLQFKTSLEEWEHVEKSEIWQLEMVELELFPHLVLSYNELSPALKRCFSYCAVYPKDHQIDAERLIEEWMALGYLGSSSENGGVELRGREYLNSLAMRSLFQDILESDGQIKWCKMHDIVHDFALFLRKIDDREEGAKITKKRCQVCNPLLVSQAQKYRSLIWDERRHPRLCNCVTSVRVLRFGWRANGFLPKGMEKLIHLRWLDFSWTTLSKDGLKIICSLYFLQTLLLSGCNITEIPREIENLVQLRHLDLSRNAELKDLPDRMYSLVELRTLSLAYCSLEEIRGEIGNLVHLRRLDLSENTKLKELPDSMYSLVELRTLSLASCSLEEIPEKLGIWFS
ncbi:putative disease resistance protein RGA1 [Salvia hispanica]|uniref:putative disease resistance protein RGA1 n=1 Tax=Salvia hispanica TaxID=49212 RepID=UPI0020098FDE|nr:putative disease resistance protein RGA1 [Salvia hispanica]